MRRALVIASYAFAAPWLAFMAPFVVGMALEWGDFDGPGRALQRAAGYVAGAVGLNLLGGFLASMACAATSYGLSRLATRSPVGISG